MRAHRAGGEVMSGVNSAVVDASSKSGMNAPSHSDILGEVFD